MLRPGPVLTAIAWLPFTALANQYGDIETGAGTIERWKGTQNSTHYYGALPKSPGVHRSQADLQIATVKPLSNEVHIPVQAIGGPGVEAIGMMGPTSKYAETTPTTTQQPGIVISSVPAAQSNVANRPDPLVTLVTGITGIGVGFNGLMNPHISQAMLLEGTPPIKTIPMPMSTGTQGPVVGEAFAHSTVANKPGGNFGQSTSEPNASGQVQVGEFHVPQAAFTEVHIPQGIDMIGQGLVHSTKANLVGGGYMELGQMGEITTTTPTTTSNTILMSGFVFGGTTYPPLPLVQTRIGSPPVTETSSSPTAITLLQTQERHDSKTAIILITPSTIIDQPAITMPTAYALTTDAPAPMDTNSKVLMSAFTFRGTTYPAVPMILEAASSTAQPDIPTATLPFPIPAIQDIPYRAGPGISISGLPIPTTLGNDAGPKPLTTSSPSLITSTPQPALLVEPAFTTFYDQSTTAPIPLPPSNPGLIALTGSAGGAQSFITTTTTSTSRAYALTTDRSGFVRLRPGVTGGVWWNGTGGGYVGPSGLGGGNGNGTGTGGVVPYFGGAGRCRGMGMGRGWWWWGWGWKWGVVGVGVWWGVVGWG